MAIEKDTCFTSFDVLIPNGQYLASWPVIACDQFTSQPEYWEEVRSAVGDSPSALHCILPEAELSRSGEETYSAIRKHMKEYLQSSVFRECRDSFIFVERTLQDGSIRAGVVGMVDLEQYDYHRYASSPVRATERTVEERIPPRMQIRRGAPLELSHVLLLCDDARDRLFAFLRARKDELEPVYDLELPMGGGRLRGYLVDGAVRDAFQEQLALYREDRVRAADGEPPLLYVVGDGNHSLASAKACYEELKQNHAGAEALRHARYAMAELENLRDCVSHIEPIHRILQETDPEAVLRFLQERCGTDDPAQADPVHWKAGDREGVLYLHRVKGQVPAGVLQDGLDAYIAAYGGSVDYIHGGDTLSALAGKERTIGFLLPEISAERLFADISAGGVLPRKTFSIGTAREKRYYMEARRLQP